MIKKRVVGVITVKNSIAVQSFGYQNYLPLGTPEILIENLEQWGVDEIILNSIDRSRSNLGPDFELIKRVSSLGFATPISYGGGIRSLKDSVSVIQSGAERIVLDALLHKNINEVKKIAEVIGSQALIASLPVEFKNKEMLHHNYLTQNSMKFSNEINDLIANKIISEVMVIDYLNEGYDMGFQKKLINKFPKDCNLILFGGVSNHFYAKNLLRYKQVVAIAVGNFLNYKEHSVDIFKGDLKGKILRQ